MIRKPWLHAALVLVLTAVPAIPAPAAVRVFANNDLGMHCYDSDFAVFAILPPFNVVHGQVLRTGATPVLLDRGQVSLRYQAVADRNGSINTTSRGKTNFWRYVAALFGASPPPDVGLLGARMPGRLNLPRPFSSFDPASHLFTAAGIPITERDNAGALNPYSLMLVRARNSAGTILASLRTVVPASEEMSCGECHATGGVAATDPNITWSQNPIPVRQMKENILLLHDARNTTSLFASQPVLCAKCHYSLALDLAGAGPTPLQEGKPYMSRVVHGFHATRFPPDSSTTNPCYRCHPGRTTLCLRGVMSLAGIGCTDCHGSLAGVVAGGRLPWAEEPRCGSCHTGDAVSNLGQIVRRTAYDGTPDAPVPVVPVNTRFAENASTLYRKSFGHGGMTCEACHGSPHAEWPSREANDNLAALSLQRHSGYVGDCPVCHGNGLPLTLNGPHGMHNVPSQAWVDGHDDLARSSLSQCTPCHGLAGVGTILSRAGADRTFLVEDIGTLRIYRKSAIGCGLCHANPYLL